MMRAECGANADLARPTRHGEGHQRVDAGRGKQQHDKGHQPGHDGQRPVDPRLFAADLAELLNASEPDPRVDLGRDRAQAHRKRIRIAHAHYQIRRGAAAGKCRAIHHRLLLGPQRLTTKVLHHSHDLEPLRRVDAEEGQLARIAQEPDALANGVARAEYVASERLVHDQDASSQGFVLERRKIATRDDRRVKRTEVAA